jgi:hypothetical protein|tara:strand:+ start:81 stop:428 length:348 start_codon:yes stop_codon:yes gene_type:complete
MRTLILDKEGNAIITTNDEYNLITILEGERYVKGTHIPSKKFCINSLDSIRCIRDFLNSVISKGEKIDSLSLEHEALVKEFLKNKDEKTSKRLKEIKLEFIKLRGKTASNGRINI